MSEERRFAGVWRLDGLSWTACPTGWRATLHIEAPRAGAFVVLVRDAPGAHDPDDDPEFRIACDGAPVPLVTWSGLRAWAARGWLPAAPASFRRIDLETPALAAAAPPRLDRLAIDKAPAPMMAQQSFLPARIHRAPPLAPLAPAPEPAELAALAAALIGDHGAAGLAAAARALLDAAQAGRGVAVYADAAALVLRASAAAPRASYDPSLYALLGALAASGAAREHEPCAF